MEKTITMQNIMKGLNINIGDIVVVNKQALICNDKYDLVKPDGSYCSTIPNLILGMVSGKYDYQTYISKGIMETTDIFADGKVVGQRLTAFIEYEF